MPSFSGFFFVTLNKSLNARVMSPEYRWSDSYVLLLSIYNIIDYYNISDTSIYILQAAFSNTAYWMKSV